MKTRTQTLNGLDTKQMFETIEHVRSNPALACFQFRAKNHWVSGGENHSTIRDFYGAGREDDSRTEPFALVNGEPPVLLGKNEGANPVEYLLSSLVGCMTTAVVLHATARGITIRSISSRVEGELDLQGLLGLDDRVSAGYQSIRMEMDVEADCSDEELDDLLAFAREHSPLYNTLSRPVPVVIERAVRA